MNRKTELERRYDKAFKRVCDLHAAYTRSRSAADEAAWKDAKAKMYRLLERLRAAEFSPC